MDMLGTSAASLVANQAVLNSQSGKENSVLQKLKGGTDEEIKAAAQEFESVVISQMLRPMFASLPTDGPLGGGHAEETYRSMLIDEYGKAITNSGGIGIAEHVQRQLIKLQGGE